MPAIDSFPFEIFQVIGSLLTAEWSLSLLFEIYGDDIYKWRKDIFVLLFNAPALCATHVLSKFNQNLMLQTRYLQELTAGVL